MLKKFIPDYYYDDISKIDIEVLKKGGYKAVICDLDNTLDCHETKTPSQNALLFLDKLKTHGFTLCVISNGKEERVKKYLSGLDIPYIAKAGKPLKKSYLSALKTIGFTTNETVFIGDQIFTDVWGANRLGIATVLVEPIKSYENAFFYIKRALEKIVKSKITKEWFDVQVSRRNKKSRRC